MERAYWRLTAGFLGTQEEAEAAMQRIEQVCTHGPEACDRDFYGVMMGGPVTGEHGDREPVQWLLLDQLRGLICDLATEGVSRETLETQCAEAISDCF